MQRSGVSLGSSKARTDGLVIGALSLSSAFYVSFVRWKESDFFSNFYKGSPRSPSRDMNGLRAVWHPTSH
jgi:hypothetical protein